MDEYRKNLKRTTQLVLCAGIRQTCPENINMRSARGSCVYGLSKIRAQHLIT